MYVNYMMHLAKVSWYCDNDWIYDVMTETVLWCVTYERYSQQEETVCYFENQNIENVLCCYWWCSYHDRKTNNLQASQTHTGLKTFCCITVKHINYGCLYLCALCLNFAIETIVKTVNFIVSHSSLTYRQSNFLHKWRVTYFIHTLCPACHNLIFGCNKFNKYT